MSTCVFMGTLSEGSGAGDGIWVPSRGWRCLMHGEGRRVGEEGRCQAWPELPYKRSRRLLADLVSSIRGTRQRLRSPRLSNPIYQLERSSISPPDSGIESLFGNSGLQDRNKGQPSDQQGTSSRTW